MHTETWALNKSKINFDFWVPEVNNLFKFKNRNSMDYFGNGNTNSKKSELLRSNFSPLLLLLKHFTFKQFSLLLTNVFTSLGLSPV